MFPEAAERAVSRLKAVGQFCVLASVHEGRLGFVCPLLNMFVLTVFIVLGFYCTELWSTLVVFKVLCTDKLVLNYDPVNTESQGSAWDLVQR